MAFAAVLHTDHSAPRARTAVRLDAAPGIATRTTLVFMD